MGKEVTNHGEGKEIYFHNDKPRFVFECGISSVYGLGEMYKYCNKNKNCTGLVERRIYIDNNGFVLRKLEKRISLDNESEVIIRISNTHNKELSVNDGESFKYDFTEPGYKKIENCHKTDVYYHSIFPNELNGQNNYNMIHPVTY